MSVRMSNRDLDALRVGITKQVERETRMEISQEDMARRAAFRSVSKVRLIEARELEPGMRFAEGSYRSFKVMSEVIGVNREGFTEEGERCARDIWVTYKSMISEGVNGSAFQNDDLVLISDESPAGDPEVGA
jgi:Zn-finger domain-containing protein